MGPDQTRGRKPPSAHVWPRFQPFLMNLAYVRRAGTLRECWQTV